ncbi:amidohydrolase family protein [Phenylobacterium sp. LjRoot225]|uniref:amidohydrolase family protein n=1 Tax=Phenylobacterium sp. LjRoot225 TaxID=3342285 RepID=UPI003ED1146E
MLTLTNAKLFDGQKMRSGQWSVTLDGDRIAAVSDAPAIPSGETLDLGGMTLMPGLITGHFHPDFYKFDFATAMRGDQLGKELPPGVGMAMGVRNCRVLLESGFTGYAGAGCAHDIDASLKIAIREGIIPGPRILACGHHCGTTADANAAMKWWQAYQTPGIDVFADGPDAMRKLVREEIRRGVEVIKIFASPGHLIPGHRGPQNMAYDEIAAVVEAAHQRGAKVRAHVCTKDVILQCVELGVDIIDHGDEVDDECIEALVASGAFWVPSLTFTKVLIDMGADATGEYVDAWTRLRPLLTKAHKAGVRILIGDDYSGLLRGMIPDDPLDHVVGAYGRELPFYNEHIEGLSAADILTWGTKNPGELLGGPAGKVGVVETGALADLIVVDGDPVADLSLLARPDEALKAVIRDGALVIDRLPQQSRRLAAA